VKIAVFTSNNPRHFALLRALSDVADEVIAIQECGTLFPGKMPGYYPRSDVMERYFSHVRKAERDVFGEIGHLPKNVRVLALNEGDINFLPTSIFREALEAEEIVVYSASYLKDPLCAELVERKAVNIHVGVSPFYRGSSCNFWAMQEGNFDLVGATVHLLSSGLDSGAILFHAFPSPIKTPAFVYGMLSVKAAQLALASAIADGSLRQSDPVAQDKSLQIRYTKGADFTDEVAQNYLDNLPSEDAVFERCVARRSDGLIRVRLETVEPLAVSDRGAL